MQEKIEKREPMTRKEFEQGEPFCTSIYEPYIYQYSKDHSLVDKISIYTNQRVSTAYIESITDEYFIASLFFMNKITQIKIELDALILAKK